jgi:hypothetical protein
MVEEEDKQVISVRAKLATFCPLNVNGLRAVISQKVELFRPNSC